VTIMQCRFNWMYLEIGHKWPCGYLQFIATAFIDSCKFCLLLSTIPYTYIHTYSFINQMSYTFNTISRAKMEKKITNNIKQREKMRLSVWL